MLPERPLKISHWLTQSSAVNWTRSDFENKNDPQIYTKPHEKELVDSCLFVDRYLSSNSGRYLIQTKVCPPIFVIRKCRLVFLIEHTGFQNQKVHFGSHETTIAVFR